MNLSYLLDRYEHLAEGAEKSFEKIKKEHGQKVQCKVHCSDCCHAVFGLFLIEAVYLKMHFDRLGRSQRRSILSRCHRADKELFRIQKNLKVGNDSLEEGSDLLGKARVRCPLLNNMEECELYPYRPITCRVYGIPTSIRGKARVCGKSGFENGIVYTTFDLDNVYRELYQLSRNFLEKAGSIDPRQAELLISVSNALSTPLNDFIAGIP